MSSKHLRYIIGTITLIVLVYLLYPRPLVENTETSHIKSFLYNPCYGQNVDSDMVNLYISPENEKEILTCLRRYKEQKSLAKANECQASRTIAFEILLEDVGQSKWITIGNPSYSYESYGKLKCRIVDGDSLQGDLMDLLDVSPLKSKLYLE